MKNILISVLLATLSFASIAQDKFSVATGDSKGGSTYSIMYRELAKQCGAELNLAEQETTGSVKNLELLTGNSVNAAIVQTDLLFYFKVTDSDKVSNIRTLASLHPEELHFIARADVKKEGGVLGIGATKVTYNKVTDLKDRTVGAVGGSVLSARVFSSQSGLNFKVQEFSDNATLTAALLGGTIDSILVVGGAPHKLVQSLDTRYRLLSVDDVIATKVSGMYTPTKLSYTNLRQEGVRTVSTQALLVTRVYRSASTLAKLASLRKCFIDSVGDIQDKTGTHPKWQVVDPANKGKWNWYEF